MAAGTSRNITDFFKPFAQPRRSASAPTQRSASEHVQSAMASPPARRSRRLADSHPFTSSSSPSKPSRETLAHVPTPASSLSPTPTPRARDAPRRFVLELSPLSSPSSPEPSAVPSPPSTLPKVTDTAPLLDPTSSLSSLPRSSQNSSKRIVRDGMLAVTNSDSDSIDADSDPLDDIDELIRQKRINMSHTAASASETPKQPLPQERELRSSTRRDRLGIKRRRLSSPPRKKYKFSLASLVASSAKDAAMNQKIKRYEDEHQHDADEVARHSRVYASPSGMTAEQFANRVQQGDDADDEEKDRLVRALKRSDVLERDVKYQFFRHTVPAVLSRPPFPTRSIPAQHWTGMLKEQESREESFISGFAADMARISSLPEELVDWLFCEILHEPATDLAHGYVRTLENSFIGSSFSTQNLRIQLLRRTGREDLEPDLFPEDLQRTPAHQRPFVDETPISLKWASMFLGSVADKLGTGERRSWLPILMLLLLDPKYGEDVETQEAIQACIASLLDADSSKGTLRATSDYVGQRILDNVANPILDQQLVRSLPSHSTSLHTFKRRLSLASFMKSKDYLSDDLDDVSTMAAVTTYLQGNGKFKIKESTDFRILGARFGILDVAVGAGFSGFEFSADQATYKVDSPVNTETVRSRAPPSAEEANFNSAIDKLVGELRLIAFNIRDTGATHMRRTECKMAIEKLAYRLEFSARTRAKPKKGIFGAVAGSSDMIRAFVGREQTGQGQQDRDKRLDIGYSSGSM